MKLTIQQLSQQKQLLPIYLIASEALLLREEALNHIRQKAQQQGYNEHIKITINNVDDWQTFQQHTQTFSLFADKKLIELHFESKPSQRLIDPFTDYCQNPLSDLCVVMVSPKLDKQLTTKKWFKAIEQNGGVSILYPPKPQQFPNWLQQRLQQANLKLEPDAFQLLLTLTQGNLLAAQQATQRLQLLNHTHSIDYDTVLASCDNAGYFDVFKLADACIQGDHKTVQAALEQLQAADTQPLIILWALARDLRTALAIAEDCRINQLSPAQSLQHNKVWQTRQALFKNLLNHCSISLLSQYLQLAAHIDLAAKGAQNDDPHQLLATLAYAVVKRQAPVLPQQEWLLYP